MMNQGSRSPIEKSAPAARIRGDIQRGYTGDKVAGFDPAAAPLETDAEAAGTPQPFMPNERQMTITEGVPTQVNSSSHGTAMRPFEGHERSTRHLFPVIIFALILAIALAGSFWLYDW